MGEAMPLLPNTSSWRGAYLITVTALTLTLTLQDVQWDKRGSRPADDYTFVHSYGKARRD
jgi:hypothetical protein